MRLILACTAALLLILVAARESGAQGCFGPVCVTPGPAGPAGPPDLCLPDGCRPIRYGWIGDLATAASELPDGYPVMGWSGPCPSADRAACPDVYNQAAADLLTNALRANRARRLAPPMSGPPR